MRRAVGDSPFYFDYTYDNLGQINSAARTPAAAATENFTYGLNGNPDDGDPNTNTIVVSDFNRLTQDANYTYQYDNEGNLTFRESATEQTNYEWDHRNRLTQVATIVTATGELLYQVDYHYDVLNRRVGTDVSGDNILAGAGERYVFDGDHAALHLDMSAPNLAKRRNLWGPGSDQILASETGNLDGSMPGGSTAIEWPMADHQGTVRNIKTQGGSGALISVSYDAFGKPELTWTGTAAAYTLTNFSYLYTGQYYEAATGLQYSRARWYDPAARRWISEDPIGFAGGDTNLYRYANNSPGNFTDPTGQFVISGSILAGLTVKAVITYFAVQATFAAVETGVEYLGTSALGTDEDSAQFSTLNTFGKNFGINVLTGGLGGKARTGTKISYLVGKYALRQSIEIAGDTAYDVYNGRDLTTSLATNAIGSVLGEGIGVGIGYGVRAAGRGLKSLDYGEFQSIVSASPIGRMIAPNGRMPGVFAAVGDVRKGVAHRIGGGNATNLTLKAAEKILSPPGISVHLGGTAANAAEAMRRVFGRRSTLGKLARVVGSAELKAIRGIGFDVIPDPTKNFPNHGRLIHPNGVEGFTTKNLAKLSEIFRNQVGL